MTSSVLIRTSRRLTSFLALIAICLGSTTPLATAATSPPMMNREIRDAVEDELVADPGVSPEHIDIDIKSGVVMLSGRVNNLLAKERAARLAETVKGVRAVVNEIEVTPAEARSDEAIRQDVQTALRLYPLDKSDKINVQVNESAVTLSGRVQSWPEKQLAARAATGVKGATALTNDINVLPEGTRPDGEIKADIEQKLRWDVQVDDAMIDVKVQNAKVTLKGVVGSAAEKRVATEDAWVAGVTSVDASGLEVQRWARDAALRQDKYVVKSNEALREAIEDALLYDLRVNSSNVAVEVTNGVVRLRGTVDTLQAKRAAAQDARNTVGVRRVRNRLKVRPADAPSDDVIAGHVRDALQRNPYVELYEVAVEATNGVVRLAGTVNSYFEKAQADEIAARVNGVIAVDNDLLVAKVYEPLVYDSYIDDAYVYDYPWYNYRPAYSWKTDAQIQDDIKDQFWWSPFVDSDDVKVEVKNGVATLTGTVDSQMEWESATENAHEGGAMWVFNKLEVK